VLAGLHRVDAVDTFAKRQDHVFIVLDRDFNCYDRYLFEKLGLHALVIGEVSFEEGDGLEDCLVEQVAANAKAHDALHSRAYLVFRNTVLVHFAEVQ